MNRKKKLLDNYKLKLNFGLLCQCVCVWGGGGGGHIKLNAVDDTVDDKSNMMDDNIDESVNGDIDKYMDD